TIARPSPCVPQSRPRTAGDAHVPVDQIRAPAVRDGVGGGGVLPAADPDQPGRGRWRARGAGTAVADGAPPVPLRPRDVRAGPRGRAGAVAALRHRRRVAARQAGAGGADAGALRPRRPLAGRECAWARAALDADAADLQRAAGVRPAAGDLAGAGQAVLSWRAAQARLRRRVSRCTSWVATPRARSGRA